MAINNLGQIVGYGTTTSGATQVFLLTPVTGSSQYFPVLPNNIANGVMTFTNVTTGQWFDPTYTNAFIYQMTSGSLFTGIPAFPTGFSSPFTVMVGNEVLGTFGPGQSVNFSLFAGGGVSEFEILGINPGVDATQGTAFPLELSFNMPTASFTMTATVPEPTSIVLALTSTGLCGVLQVGKRGRRSAS